MMEGVFLLLQAVQAAMQLSFAARYTRSRAGGGQCAAFVLVSCLLSFAQGEGAFLFGLGIRFATLLFMGAVVWKKRWAASAMAALLAVEVMQLSFGIGNSLLCLLSPLVYGAGMGGWMGRIAAAASLLSLAAGGVLLRFITKRPPENAAEPYVLLVFAPLLLVFFAGEFISDSVYGNVVTVNRSGWVLGINHVQMLFIQLLALGSVFVILTACRRLEEGYDARTRLEMLGREARMQREYVAEAQARYEQTRAFRHDIKNHLTVLKGLLQSGEADKAEAYLGGLDGIADDLSLPCRTGLPVLDILVKSKLGLARRAGIRCECSLDIPAPCGVEDMDWCIIFANALDNAVNACGSVEEGERFIRVFGKKQGDLFMVEFQNSCAGERKPLVFGTGLHNIESAAQKYGGAMSAEESGGIFRLNVLLVLSQHGEDIS